MASGFSFRFALLAALLGFFPGVAPAESKPPLPLGRPIVLPPFVVSEKFRGVPWRYGAVPGSEVLSLCDDVTTEQFLRNAWRLDRYLEMLAPPEFQFQTAVPREIILYDGSLAAEIQREMASAMDQAEQKQQAGVEEEARWGVRAMPNLQLRDSDSIAMCCVLDDGSPAAGGSNADQDFGGLTFTEDEVRFRLGGRRPPLPGWFIDGVIRLVAGAEVVGGGLRLPPIPWPRYPAVPDTPVPFLPMEQLLVPPPPPGQTAAEQMARLKWNAQAEIFVRWASEEEDGAYLPAFRKFVARCCGESPSRKMFEECFGFDYEAMTIRLHEFWTNRCQRHFTLRYREQLAFPAPGMRKATSAEIGRLKGDWERRAISFVRAKYPEFLPLYTDEARITLMFPYNRGERDPRLLAAIGEFNCDAGQSDKARPFLEAAVQAGVVHPHVYFELARIRYEEALKHPAGGNGRLDSRQVAALSTLFEAIQHQAPPQRDVCELMVQVWAHAATAPSRDSLLALDEGARLFRHPPLIFAVSVLEASNGLTAEARRLIQLGLDSNPDPAIRPKLLRMQAALKE